MKLPVLAQTPTGTPAQYAVQGAPRPLAERFGDIPMAKGPAASAACRPTLAPPSSPAVERTPLADSVVNRSLRSLEPDSLEIEGFQHLEPRSYSWTQRYDAVSNSELLQTHCDHRLLSPVRLEALLREVIDIIEHVGGAEITNPCRTDLLIA